jgi:3-deoxy-D-manno-octulosonic-acid transferase
VYTLYSALLGIAFVLAVPYFLWKGRATGKYSVSFRERMGEMPPDLNPEGIPSIWVHAVSVGEVLAARVLLGPLRQRFPGLRIVVSTTTLTGHFVARSSLDGADALFFAPFDFRWPVRRALAVVKPRLLLLVETELWPNLIHEARRAGVRMAVANGRLSPRSSARYRRIRFLLKHVLAEVDLFLMQGEAHAERARAIGAPPDRVRVTGNLKFDALGEPATPESPGPLLVAGSTMAGEEEMVLSAFRQVRARLPQARLVLVPRHPERFAEAEGLVRAADFTCVRRTALGAQPWSSGEVMGPHMENFQEIADQFNAEAAIVQVASPGALADALLGLLTDEARRREVGDRARALVLRSKGAVGRTVEALSELMG